MLKFQICWFTTQEGRQKLIFDLLTLNGRMCVCFREVKNHLLSNGSLSQDDFVLMTLFPQRRISDMESTLESAGNGVDYIFLTLIDPVLWCSGLWFSPKCVKFKLLRLLQKDYNRFAGRMIIRPLLFCRYILISFTWVLLIRLILLAILSTILSLNVKFCLHYYL